LIDLDNRDKLLSYTLKILDKKTINGARVSNAWATNQHFYFHLETSVPYSQAKYFVKNGQHKLLLTFPDKTTQILVKVGMSAVDEEGAKQNLLKEIPDWNFDAVRAETVKKWNNELGKIDFQTEDKAILINFYSALYHSYLNPNIFSDVDGRYRGRDSHVHQLGKNEAPQFTVFSLWDTYRAAHPLFTIMQQKRTDAFIHTFMRQYEQGHDLPVWELAGNETDCMIGYHSVSVIADAYIKGIINYDTEAVLNAMIVTSNLNELAKPYYGSHGFISASLEPESVSKTLEYAYDDFCISQFAKYTDHQAIHDDYLKRSFNFINVFDPQTKFMRARREGIWFSPFEPSEVNFNYTEANSWQYSLYAPHAIGVLENMIGGDDSLELWLDKLFTTESILSGREQADITGLIGQYAHGNEPSHHMAYLYNYTNSPEKTQFYVDKILKEMYSPTPDGLSGNEDCGQMSSWYVLSSMGLYQVAPASPYYDLGRPIMNEASLELENGKIFTISVINNSSENKYIQSVKLNGLPIYRTYLHHNEIMAGGILEFTMGNEPVREHDKFVSTPTISKTAENFIAVPFFKQEKNTFEDKMEIALDYPMFPSDLKDFKIEYSTTDGVWNEYNGPFIIEKSTTVRAKLTAKNLSAKKIESAVVENQFIKRDADVHLKLFSTYANQYAAGGETSLIDGVRGGSEFRTGDWQGFDAKDLVAEVSFDNPKVLSEVGISCLEDMKSWIFFPSSVEIEISHDGITFEKLKVIGTIPYVASNGPGNDYIPSFSTYVVPMNREFFVKTNTTKPISKIRVTAKNFGKCPEWHLGAGNNTWLFADEIIFR